MLLHYKCTAHGDIQIYFITKNFLLKMQTWRWCSLCCNLLVVSNFVKLANNYDLNLFLHAIWCIVDLSIVDQNTFFPNFFFRSKEFHHFVYNVYSTYIYNNQIAIVNVCTYSLNLSNSFKIENFDFETKN